MDIAAKLSITFNHTLEQRDNTLTKTGDGAMAINNILLTGDGELNCGEGTCAGAETVGGDLNNIGGTISPGMTAGHLTVVPEPLTCNFSLILIGLFYWHLR